MPLTRKQRQRIEEEENIRVQARLRAEESLRDESKQAMAKGYRVGCFILLGAIAALGIIICRLPRSDSSDMSILTEEKQLSEKFDVQLREHLRQPILCSNVTRAMDLAAARLTHLHDRIDAVKDDDKVVNKESVLKALTTDWVATSNQREAMAGLKQNKLCK